MVTVVLIITVMLIIAVVLGALFSLGVFNGSLSSACVAQSGYLCQSPLYSHTTGIITIPQLGQNTGTTWASANFVYVPQSLSGTTAGIPTLMSPQAAVAANGNIIYGLGTIQLLSGQEVAISLPVNTVSTNSLAHLATPLTIGTSTSGAIWVEYTTSANPTTFQYAEIATLNLKAS